MSGYSPSLCPSEASVTFRYQWPRPAPPVFTLTCVCVSQRKSPAGMDVPLCLHAASSYSGAKGIFFFIRYCTAYRKTRTNNCKGEGSVSWLVELPPDVSISVWRKRKRNDFPAPSCGVPSLWRNRLALGADLCHCFMSHYHQINVSSLWESFSTCAFPP